VSLKNLWTKRGTTGSVSAPDFHDWHDSTRLFAAMGYYTFTSDSDISVGVDGAPGYAAVTLVSPEFFNVFATPAVVGRTLSTADAATPLSVISHEFWMHRFNGRADIVGQSIDVARRSIPIVGVMPPGFAFPGHTHVWVSAALLPETTSRGAHNYRVVALLRDGASVDAVKAELSAVAARLEAAYPNTNAGKSATAIPLQEQLVGDTRNTLLMLFGVVALV